MIAIFDGKLAKHGEIRGHMTATTANTDEVRKCGRNWRSTYITPGLKAQNIRGSLNACKIYRNCTKVTGGKSHFLYMRIQECAYTYIHHTLYRAETPSFPSICNFIDHCRDCHWQSRLTHFQQHRPETRAYRASVSSAAWRNHISRLMTSQRVPCSRNTAQELNAGSGPRAVIMMSTVTQ